MKAAINAIELQEDLKCIVRINIVLTTQISHHVSRQCLPQYTAVEIWRKSHSCNVILQ